MSTSQAFVIDKNLGARWNEEDADLPKTNSVGIPAVRPSEEQKYLFDMRGWLLLPGVLTASECAEMRAFAKQLHHDPESLPEHERCAIAGPLQALTDHPLVVGFMNEFVAYPGLSSQECYGFRQESAKVFYREVGDGNFQPHNGNGMFRFPGDSHLYRCIPGKANSGLTRVVWELNPVTEGNGTLLITGSHKAVYPAPEAVWSPDSPIWDSYSCPEGSLILFTESLTHSARPWIDADRPRIAIFSCYNTVNSKWHDWDPPAELVAAMPPKRQTLYRPVHVAGNLVENDKA